MKKTHLVLFGTGNVGSTFIKQVLAEKKRLVSRGLEVNIPVIANSTTAFFAKDSFGTSWETDFENFGFPYKLEEIIQYVQEKEFENLIAVDITASEAMAQSYSLLIQSGFHLIAANKIANSLSTRFYENLRKDLKKHKKFFLYETNVGAGLPIIQTIQDLQQAGEQFTKLRGVFSGSLSYIFNTFSAEDRSFSDVVQEAQEKGFTEPDPRIDLAGTDVGRKLLILARELSLKRDFSEVEIESLVPHQLNGKSSLKHFKANKKSLDAPFGQLKESLGKDEVLRHVGELDVASGKLQVKLVKEPKLSAFGGLQHADAAFEIYTESYQDQPLVIQGAGAGTAVTARGILSDLLKLAEKLP